MTTYLIVGASRGIGYAFVEALSSDKNNLVIATARTAEAAAKLEALGSNVKTISVDMQDSYAQFETAFKKLDVLAPKGVDVFIHNAGIFGPRSSLKAHEYEVNGYKDVLDVNVGGPAKSYKAAYRHIFRGHGTKKIAFVSSSMGQIGFSVDSAAYGASKAALNHLGVEIARQNTESDVEVVRDSVTILLCPGLVATDMTKEFHGEGSNVIGKSRTPEASVAQVLNSLAGVTTADSGKFFSIEGTAQPFSVV